MLEDSEGWCWVHASKNSGWEKLSNSPFYTMECTNIPLAIAVSEQSSVQVLTKHNVAWPLQVVWVKRELIVEVGYDGNGRSLEVDRWV
jgi:hypothetical protein